MQFTEKELIAEITKRDDYIKASDNHHLTVLETLKARFSSEVANRRMLMERLEARVKSLESDKSELVSALESARGKHAQDSTQLITKMKTLVEERNNLLMTNIAQRRTIDELTERLDRKSVKENDRQASANLMSRYK